jgi:hypothetical protein
MNLNGNPTKEELRRLVSQQDDRRGHHVLWVSDSGEVHLSLVPADLTPVGFQQAHPEMRLRYETFQRGNEYVGPAAAEDDEWISQLFDHLVKQWGKAKSKAGVEYIDLF